MPRKVRQVYTNFSAGELNSLLNARTDAKAYFEGAKQCRNWYLLDEGGLMRRPATEYKATLPAQSRLIPFIFSNDETALFAFSNNRLDVYSSTGSVVQANITSNCNWSTAQLFELNFAQFGDTVFITHRNNPIRKIVRASASSFSVSAFEFELDDTVTTNGVSKTTAPFHRYADPGVTITPSATSSKILLFATGDGNPGTGTVWNYIRFFRDSTDIGNYVIMQTAGSSYNSVFALHTLDSPSSTSAITYKIQAKQGSGTMTYGEEGATQSPTITAIEVGG